MTKTEVISRFLGNRTASWFQDGVFRRLILNSGKLLTANAVAAGLAIVVAMLTARALEPSGYGMLALLLVYQETVGKLVGFNGWQAIIKYGSEALAVDDWIAFRQLIKFGFSLDLSSAVIGTVLAIVLSGPVTNWLGWGESIQPLLVLYSLLILFSLTGTPIGVLRLFDRFDLLGYAAVLNVGLRLLGVIGCLLTEQGLGSFVLVYLVTGILGQLFQLVAALWILFKNGAGDFARVPFHGFRERFPGIWDYVWTTNVNSTIRLLSREADELIIAGLTAPASLGLFKIAKQFARALAMLADPLYQSLYPELTRLWAAGNRERFFSVVKRSSVMASIVAILAWVGFVLFGRWAIAITVGASYQAAYSIAIVYMLAVCLSLCAVAFQPSMLAMGLPKISLKILLLATIVYFGLLFPLVGALGVLGASVAYFVFYLCWSLMMFIYLRRVLGQKA